MQPTPWRLTDCASTAYPHRRIQNTSFDCATPPPRTSTASFRPLSPCLWTTESTKPDSERGVGAILGGRTDPTRCPRTLHAIRETPTCAPGARCSVFLLALFARLDPASTFAPPDVSQADQAGQLRAHHSGHRLRQRRRHLCHFERASSVSADGLDRLHKAGPQLGGRRGRQGGDDPGGADAQVQ